MKSQHFEKSNQVLIMLPRIIFCSAVVLATLAVILLALLSPVAHRKQSKNHPRPWLQALSLYIQQPNILATSDMHPPTQSGAGAAFIFHRTLTEGPENTSRPVGSLSVEAKHVEHKNREELTVVGGTGSFAFARGLAVFAQTDNQTYHVKLQLKFPNRSQKIPG
ncbi:hypothetical protein ACOSP7_010839 [Xanthoceras sorbifolium]